MPLYSALDVIGKTIIPKVDVPVLDGKPDLGGKVVGTVKAGNSILVDSYIINSSTGDLYWTFYTGYPRQFRCVKHGATIFGFNELKQQGVLTDIEKLEAEKEKNKSLSDKAFDFLKYGVLIFAGVSILNTVIKSK